MEKRVIRSRINNLYHKYVHTHCIHLGRWEENMVNHYREKC